MIENNLYKTLSIKSVQEIIEGFKTFSFNDDHAIIYKPGQYLTLVSHSHNEEIRRSYSITSSPVLNEPLSIGVKRIENGFFSRLLVDNAVEGDELITIGAGGLFVLPDDISNYQQVFFFAAGSGITPIYSLIKTLLYTHAGIDVVLIYSNVSESKTVFLHELKMLEEKFSKRFQVKFLFSNIVHLSKARLHRKLLEEFLNELSVADYAQTLFYTCGPESYMRLCTYTLQENDVPKTNIKREDFVINAIRKRDAFPPDKHTHEVKIIFNKDEFKFPVHYPDSIFAGGKKSKYYFARLTVVQEAGRCASCVARCIKGKVWHSYNEVLTAKDILQGLILASIGADMDWRRCRVGNKNLK